MTGMKAERAGQPLAPALRGERLMVVDDDPDVRDSLERALRCAGYAVTTAVHGADALDTLALSPVDLIVLDVMMPMVDGFDACRRLRARGDDTPILVLTARDAVDDRVTGLAAGADDYLVKPFALRELLARVQALLRRSRTSRDVLGYADLTLDVTARRLTRGGRVIELTRTEFGLLELLLRNAEQVISYDVIRERVWGYGEAPVVQRAPGLRRTSAAQARVRRRPAAAAQRARRGLRDQDGPVTAWRERLRLRRPLMLRTRFTLAAAGAVAAVTLAVTAVAFLVLRSDLQDQVQQQLRQQSDVVHRVAGHYHGRIPRGWVPPHSDRFGVSSPYAQVVTDRGAVWAPPGDGRLLVADAAAMQVAAGRHVSFYAVSTLDGVRAMVYTTPLAPGLAVQLAVPLATVDQQVTSVGTTLALLSVIGVGLAALAGWGVARAGLAPVGRLAAVAEDVTATGDPGRRVEVNRADELGRLAASFNTMLGALQRSLTASGSWSATPATSCAPR